MKNWYPLPILLLLAGCAKQEAPTTQLATAPTRATFQRVPPVVQGGRPPSPALTKRATLGAGMFAPNPNASLSKLIKLPTERGNLSESQFKYLQNVARVLKTYDTESAHINIPFQNPRSRQLEAAIRRAELLHNRIKQPEARFADYHWMASEGFDIAQNSFVLWRAASRLKDPVQQANAQNHAGVEFSRGIGQLVRAVQILGIQIG